MAREETRWRKQRKTSEEQGRLIKAVTEPPSSACVNAQPNCAATVSHVLQSGKAVVHTSGSAESTQEAGWNVQEPARTIAIAHGTIHLRNHVSQRRVGFDFGNATKYRDTRTGDETK